jgi:hypothetical protein
LKNELKAEHSIYFIPYTALTASLHAGVFIWDQPDLPCHVSYFFCGDTGHLGTSGEESLQLQLKSEGAGLSSSEIGNIAKQTRHSPNEFHKTQYQMGNYFIVYAFETGIECAIAPSIKTMVDHMTIHHRTYIQLQIQDRSFLSNIGFTMDVAVQSFLHSCRLSATVEYMVYESLDLSPLHNRISCFSFDIMLLDVLKPSPPKYITYNSTKIKEGRASCNSAVRDNSKFKQVSAKNSNEKAICKLKPGEKYSDVTVHRAHCSKIREQEICMRFQIRGFYNSGCTHKHNLERNEEPLFTTFVKNCSGWVGITRDKPSQLPRSVPVTSAGSLSPAIELSTLTTA